MATDRWSLYKEPPEPWTKAITDALNDPSEENVSAFIEADLRRMEDIELDMLVAMLTIRMCANYMAEMADKLPREQRPRGAWAWHKRANQFLRKRNWEQARREALSNSD